MSRLECGAKMVDGWLGAVYSGTENGEPVRLTPIAAISTELVQDITQRAKFSKQANAPFVLQGYGINDGLLESYWVSQKIDGYPLGYLFRRGFPLPTECLIFILHSVRSTLMQSYRNGVVHGDLHPDSIYVARDGSVWVDGMGREQSTHVPPRTGEGRYFAPEKGSSLLSDLYSLGMIVLEIYLGRTFSLEGRLPTSHEAILNGLLEEIEDEESSLRSFFGSVLQYDPRARQKALRINLRASNSPLKSWCAQNFGKIEQLQMFLAPSSYFETKAPMDAIFDIDEFDDLESTHDFTDEITQITTADELSEWMEEPKKSPSKRQQTPIQKADSTRQRVYLLGVVAFSLLVFVLSWILFAS